MSTKNIQFYDKIRKFPKLFVELLEEIHRDSKTSLNQPW